MIKITTNGAFSEVSRTANSFMTILKGQPLSLALVVMNLALVVLVFYTANQTLIARQEMAALVIANINEAQALLSKCIDAEAIRTMIENLRIPR